VKVIIPIPPNWMRKRMMMCPTVVNVVATSIVVRPVTHTALVAVKRASKNDIPLVVARGRSKRPVPTIIMDIKLPTIIQLGDILFEREWVITADSFSRASIATMTIIR
jgi:hydroxymethylpyrimidine pyrophosphatase-like HAD family hydrolase